MEEKEKGNFMGKACKLCGNNHYAETYDPRRKFICTSCGYFTNDIEKEEEENFI